MGVESPGNFQVKRHYVSSLCLELHSHSASINQDLTTELKMDTLICL